MYKPKTYNMMKTMVYLVVLCLLFQSCFSYRKINIDTDEIVLEKKYKLQMVDGKKQKLKITKVNDSLIRGYSRKDKNIVLPIANVDVIKKRKFSIVKTIALPVVITGGVIGLFLITFEPGVNLGSIGY